MGELVRKWQQVHRKKIRDRHQKRLDKEENERKRSEEIDIPIENWLESIQVGFGAYAGILEACEIMSYSCIPSLTFEQFFEVSKQLRSIDPSERQKIMKALRGAKHLGNPTLRVDQEDDAVGTLAVSTDLTMKQSVSVSTIGRTMHSSKIYDDFSESDSLTYSMNSRDRSFSSSNSSKDMNKADGYYKAKAFEVFDSDTTGEAKYEDIYSKIV